MRLTCQGAKSQAACEPTISSPDFSEKHCDARAHVTCGNWDASDHDLCGYWLEAAPDHYVNEEWFGLTTPEQCGLPLCRAPLAHRTQRSAYGPVRPLW